jgi:hypothetical protein
LQTTFRPGYAYLFLFFFFCHGLILPVLKSLECSPRLRGKLHV